MVAYIWAWLYFAYVKVVICTRDMWVVQWYCIFEGLGEMCLITKVMGVVCEVQQQQQQQQQILLKIGK